MPAGVTIKIKGVEFSSLGAAAKHFNVSPHTISKNRARYPDEPDKWVELVKANKLQMPKANERTGRLTFAAAPAPGSGSRSRRFRHAPGSVRENYPSRPRSPITPRQNVGSSLAETYLNSTSVNTDCQISTKDSPQISACAID